MHSAKIMVVEDEVLVGLDIQANLTDIGYNVNSVFSEALKAIESLQEETVDLVLMDIHLAGSMDGIEAAEVIKERYDIPVIFLTAFATSDVIERASNAGAYGYLVKPFKLRELEAMVEVALYKHKTDIERVIIDNRIHRAQKYESLRLMAGGIAHKFNNNLHAVLGNLSIALSELPDESPAKHNLFEAEKATLQAAELSKQMLAFSGHSFLKLAELDLSAFINQISYLLRALLPSSVNLDLDLEHGLPLVKADAGQLKQILMALLVNSVEAINGRNGTITIRTSMMHCNSDYLAPLRLGRFLSEGLYVYIEVADTGYGIDKENLLSVFDPFYSTKFTGRGLGLASSLGIAQAHHGTISITSEPGSGTVVKVLLPVSESYMENSAEKSEKALPWRPTGTILLVDDDFVIRTITKTMLERIGFDVLVAATRDKAVDIFNMNSDKVVCILLDYLMPGPTTKEIFNIIRKKTEEVKVIICSGYGEAEATAGFEEGDLAGFLQKPFSYASLKLMLRQVLES